MSYKQAYINAIKYLPVLGAALWCLHCILLLCGFNSAIFEMLCGSSVFVLMLLFLESSTFHFCKLHKAFIFYDAFVDLCCHYQRIFGFGFFLTTARVLVLCTGLVLFFLLALKRGRICSYVGKD